ncbi:pterin 4 alpha carbinolamine dehydratase-domain-containing protein [Lipomyces arxii]|uniref:pterin 4 alpha carbinolamine dehydratase-domain-containing protein n=1 Tax=Lipomyces arxii TaxID=56418 RepID=UPI0034CD01B8
MQFQVIHRQLAHKIGLCHQSLCWKQLARQYSTEIKYYERDYTKPSRLRASTPISSEDIEFLKAEAITPWTVFNNESGAPIEITKEYRFPTFEIALLFVNKIAYYANQTYHHPEIKNFYDTVSLTMSTLHVGDSGPFVSQADMCLASHADRVVVASNFRAAIDEELHAKANKVKGQRRQWGLVLISELQELLRQQQADLAAKEQSKI